MQQIIEMRPSKIPIIIGTVVLSSEESDVSTGAVLAEVEGTVEDVPVVVMVPDVELVLWVVELLVVVLPVVEVTVVLVVVGTVVVVLTVELEVVLNDVELVVVPGSHKLAQYSGGIEILTPSSGIPQPTVVVSVGSNGVPVQPELGYKMNEGVPKQFISTD
jgi:hypothetical protein